MCIIYCILTKKQATEKMLSVIRKRKYIYSTVCIYWEKFVYNWTHAIQTHAVEGFIYTFTPNWELQILTLENPCSQGFCVHCWVLNT